MNGENSALLKSLTNVPWDVAAKTFGNNHATLVGLMTYWWISLLPQARWVIESGPSYGHLPKGVGGGMCDALLCEGKEARGILEVEGTRGQYTAEKIGKFFGAEEAYYQNISFGVLLLYAYAPEGKGRERAYPPVRDDVVIREVIRVSRSYSQKGIIVITLDKTYFRQKSGVRSRSEYYFGELSRVMGFLYEQGEEKESLSLYGER